MPLNYTLKTMRISKELDDLLNEASEKLGFKKTDLARYLLTSAVRKLKSDSIQAKGYENLVIRLA